MSGARPKGRIKPGWYLLALLTAYSIWATVALSRTQQPVAGLERVASVTPKPDVTTSETAPAVKSGVDGAPAASATTTSAAADGGLWFPVPGATLPQDPAYLPNAPRLYRRGVNQGFDFYGEDAGVPVPYGAAVIAAADGTVERADADYTELSSSDWQDLLSDVSQNRADEAQLNRLRGRQIWLSTEAGLLRYAHLSRIRRGLKVGQRVQRGEVIGYVGNSGTDDGVEGTTRGARLHFEVWRGERFFGQDKDEAELRKAAAELFVGP